MISLKYLSQKHIFDEVKDILEILPMKLTKLYACTNTLQRVLVLFTIIMHE